MPKQSAIAKGFARGLTADTVGAPADLANAFSNLLRAGVGFAGNKLGLLKPEQMPELIPNDQVPLTSDWFAKNTPLEDTGEDGYTAARIAGGFAGPAAKLSGIGSIGKTANQSQKGAIFFPEDFINQNNLSLASDAKIALPSGGVVRPIKATPDLKLFQDMKQNPRTVNLGEIFPELAGKPQFKNDLVTTRPMDPRLGGSYDALREESKINSNHDFNQMVDSLFHEVNHGGQNKAQLLDRGSNPSYFKENDALSYFDDAAAHAKNARHFPNEDLLGFYRQLRQDPGNSYRRSEGEITSRVAGGSGALMAQGGSQVPNQHLLDALIRREGGYNNAIISPKLIGNDGIFRQTFLPAQLGKGLTNKDGLLYNSLGNQIGFSPAY